MESEKTGSGTLHTLSPQEVRDALEGGKAILVDVRTPQEFALERIRGALLSPMPSFRPEHLPGQSDKRIVLHCGSGVRSKAVAERCLESGFTEIAHMDGGLGAWKSAGLAYIGTDVKTGAPEEMRKDD